jgi:hypothetical protein
MSYAEAKKEVRTAEALDAMPATRAALRNGEVSASAVQVLVSAAETNPEEFPGSEASLLGDARDVSVKELAAKVAEWRREVDRGSGELDRRRHERRSFNIAPTVDGMVKVRGELDPVGGQIVITALRAFVDAEVRAGGSDFRTPTQQRADGLVELFRRWLDSSDRPAVAGERPHLIVTIDLDTLEGRGADGCDLSEAGHISAKAAQMLACDASVNRVVMRGPSQVLDVGRKTPVVSPALRRAVVARDRGCTFPGCDRPSDWCDVHHLVPWTEGGETSLKNCTLQCRPHHGLLHDDFVGRREGDRLVFRRPDGTVIEDRAPP